MSSQTLAGTMSPWIPVIRPVQPRPRARRGTAVRSTPVARRDAPEAGTDEALMVQLQVGDEAALSQLMRRYQAPLYAFLNRRVGDAADDLFQESWIRVVRARDRFDPSRRFSTWLFQIANNLCRDRYRRLAARGRATDAFEREQRTVNPGQGQPEIPERDRMREHIARLSDKQREVLLLRYYQDMSEAEISDVLDIPRGTVKSRLHAAVKALRERVVQAGLTDAEGEGA
jgi:RNA polymerase sigma-70 factor (ECF subfamily)